MSSELSACFCSTKQLFCRCVLLQEIWAANSDLPFPCTLSDAGSNRTDHRMIDRLRRQGLLQEIWAANADLPFPCTLSDADSNRADYRMIDRLRRQGVCWRCVCVCTTLLRFLELEYLPVQGFIPTREDSLPTTPSSCGWVPIGMSSVWRGHTAFSKQMTTSMGTQPQEEGAVGGNPGTGRNFRA
jgi:hypothetical protein